jgi:hypothetical protein
VRSELVWDCKDYKKDLQKVYVRELEASRREKRLVKREEALSQREALTTELRAKLKALDQTEREMCPWAISKDFGGLVSNTCA